MLASSRKTMGKSMFFRMYELAAERHVVQICG
jgi:hypothetical protein